MKYFFLSEGWTVGRVWTVGGLWTETAWRRLPQIEKTHLCFWEKQEQMWLYRVEDAILMVEVMPLPGTVTRQNIGQVVLTRLISADQVIEKLSQAAVICKNGPDIDPS